MSAFQGRLKVGHKALDLAMEVRFLPLKPKKEQIMDEVGIINQYFSQNFIPDMPGLYENCYEAFVKYLYSDYEFTVDDKINFITLASYWSGLLKQTWRIFIKELGFEKNSFWDAFIQVFIFHQHILFSIFWEHVLKDDKEFQRLINKTSDPEWIRKVFIGIDNKWLYKKMEE